MERLVSSINIVDAPDPGPWVSDKQLVLTTGYVFKDDPEEQLLLLHQLYEQGCAGLAVKFDRFFTSPPEIMIREADKLGFPLINIPYDMALSDLLFSVMRSIIEDPQDGVHSTHQEKLEIFFDRFLNGELKDQNSVLAEGQILGLLPNRKYIVICIDYTNKNELSDSVLNTIEDSLLKAGRIVGVHTIPIKIGNQIVAIIQSAHHKSGSVFPWEQLLEMLMEKIRKYSQYDNINIGVSSEKSNVEGLYTAYRETRTVLSVCTPLAELHEHVLIYPKLRSYILLQSINFAQAQEFVQNQLGKVIEYDELHNSDLLKTLNVYFLTNKRSTDCAALLYVHKNTIKFRLAKIEELLGIDLKDVDAQFDLQLALKIMNLN